MYNKTVTLKNTAITSQGYSVQFSTDNKNWYSVILTGNSATMTREANGAVYFRIVDAKGQVKKDSYITVDVQNIDKLSPKAFSIKNAGVTTSSIKVSVLTTDASATSAYACSGIAGYRFSKDGGATWTNYQSSPEYTFTNLTETIEAKSYSIKVEAKDNAGNVISSSTTISKAINTNYYRATAKCYFGSLGDANGDEIRYYYYKTTSTPAISCIASFIGTNGSVWIMPFHVSTKADGTTWYRENNWGGATYVDPDPYTTLEYDGTTYYVSNPNGAVTGPYHEGNLLSINSQTDCEREGYKAGNMYITSRNIGRKLLDLYFNK